MNSVKGHEFETVIPLPAYIEWVMSYPTEISATWKVLSIPKKSLYRSLYLT